MTARTPFRTAVEDMRANGGAHFSVVRALGEIDGDELDVVGMVIERLRMGRTRYGPLNVRTDRRSFEAEALDESLDGMVYVAAGLLQRMVLP